MRWLGMGLAVAAAIYITGEVTPLWFFCLPAALEFIDLVTRHTTYTLYGDNDE